MKLVFAEQAWEDYLHFSPVDHKLTKRILLLIKEAGLSPFEGVVKHQPLHHALSGYWSRRINDEHRMVYRVDGDCLPSSATTIAIAVVA
jgi:toxin YoeB